jgi:hypothetical protein
MVTCAGSALAQIPDTVNSLDQGGPSAGSGGAFYSTNSDTHSPFWNPAGLGYSTSRKAGITFRNMPASRSKITGTYTAPVRTTDAETGSTEIAHVGVVLPVGENAAVGVSYDKAGAIDDVAVGPGGAGLADTGGAIRDYVERRKLDVDTVTIAYGKTSKDQTLSVGAGVVLAQAKASYSESGVPVPGSWTPTFRKTSGNGAGLIVGVQYVPKKSPNMSLGGSFRTEVKTNGGGLYDRVPARLVLGAAYRKEGMRRSNDFLVAGVQYEHYFKGARTQKFDRDSQTGLGLGLEYHYLLPGGDEIPVRVGYRTVSSGGVDYGSRNAFTYGVGYTPRNRDFSIDLSFATAKGKTDFALSASFRFR